jgi:DNA-binding MarR family transcriptional regulator
MAAAILAISNVGIDNDLMGRGLMDTSTAGALLREVARLHAHAQREQVACCNGTTSTQCQILTEVGRHGPMTLAALGRRLSLDKGWMSRAVETLVQEGLLTKQAGADDRRTIRIALSPAGATRHQQLNETLNAHAERVMSRIPPTEREQVAHALALLHHALQAEAAEAVGVSREEASQ